LLEDELTNLGLNPKFVNMAVTRKLAGMVHQALRQFPALVITGPRRAGKTTLLRKSVPQAQYVLLEDPDIQDRVRSDPRSFLESLQPPVILDEIQNTPRLLDYTRTLIDAQPRRMGQWLFAGSQEAPLMQGITESMAGRAAVLQLLPFSVAESPKVDMLRGGFPEPVIHPASRELWFSSYLQTYLERDVRSVTQVRDLPTFRRFLSLLASRHGQFLNKTDLAAPLGVAVSTIAEWLYVLEITNQIILVPPYFENFGKRLVKSPKVYWGDSGMACHLLGIQTQAELERSPFLGAIFEGFVAAEILKSQTVLGIDGETTRYMNPGLRSWPSSCGFHLLSSRALAAADDRAGMAHAASWRRRLPSDKADDGFFTCAFT
jgi:predicted AAA+ superfamily ATPase